MGKHHRRMSDVESPTDNKEHYRVVKNDEEQYSIWPMKMEIPLGWQDAGVMGEKEECLKHIGEIWTDMRPLSLRK
jgi:MbtH protein